MKEHLPLIDALTGWLGTALAFVGIAVSWGVQRQRVVDMERRIQDGELDQKEVFQRLRTAESRTGVIETKLDNIETGQRQILDEIKALRLQGR